jgi:hypothetical protein
MTLTLVTVSISCGQSFGGGILIQPPDVKKLDSGQGAGNEAEFILRLQCTALPQAYMYACKARHVIKATNCNGRY